MAPGGSGDGRSGDRADRAYHLLLTDRAPAPRSSSGSQSFGVACLTRCSPQGGPTVVGRVERERGFPDHGAPPPTPPTRGGRCLRRPTAVRWTSTSPGYRPRAVSRLPGQLMARKGAPEAHRNGERRIACQSTHRPRFLPCSPSTTRVSENMDKSKGRGAAQPPAKKKPANCGLIRSERTTRALLESSRDRLKPNQRATWPLTGSS